jgi:hypothetical protein
MSVASTSGCLRQFASVLRVLAHGGGYFLADALRTYAVTGETIAICSGILAKQLRYARGCWRNGGGHLRPLAYMNLIIAQWFTFLLFL